MLELYAARAHVYRVLRDAFSYPLTEGVLDRLLSLEPGPDTTPALRSAIAALHAALEGRRRTPDLVERLNQEHSRLIMGPGLPPAPPWGSYYRSPDGSLFGAEHQAVARVYAEHGLAAAAPGTAADHIALELEFMFEMADRTWLAVAASRQDEADQLLSVQRDFLHDHLVPLAAALADRTLAAQPEPFFAGLVPLLTAYLSLDAALISGESLPVEAV